VNIVNMDYDVISLIILLYTRFIKLENCTQNQ